MQKYKVIREHVGEKTYGVGDTREARPADVAHLVGKCLEPISEQKKSAPTKNKAAEPLKNKAAD